MYVSNVFVRLDNCYVLVNASAMTEISRVSNTPGNPGNLLEIYKVSWKSSSLVCEFAHLSLILVTILVFYSVSVQNISW